MRFYSGCCRTMCRLIRTNIRVTKTLHFYAPNHNIRTLFNSESYRRVSSNLQCKKLITTTGNSQDEELFEEVHFADYELRDELDLVPNVLLQNCNDPIMQKLNNCASIDELLKEIKLWENNLNGLNILQAVLLIRNIQLVYHNFNTDSASSRFVEQLLNREEFLILLWKIDESLSTYDPKLLSYTLRYLQKIGIPVEDKFMQNIALRLRHNLSQNFSLEICARLFKVIFKENSIRPYYMSNNLINTVLDHIGRCKNAEDLEHLSDCLRKVQKVITLDVINKYVYMVQDLLKKGYVTGANYHALLKVISFLCYSDFRDSTTKFVSECIILMEKYLDKFKIIELLLLYKVFFKNQEPGVVLNSIQRCTSKHLQTIEESAISYPEYLKLKLASSLIYFSSPTHRIQFQKDLDEYTRHCKTLDGMILLQKMFSYTKVSNENLCKMYWDKMLGILNDANNKSDLLPLLCQNYINFNTGINNYRHYVFENNLQCLIQDETEEGLTYMFPTKLVWSLCFMMLYGKSVKLLENLIDGLERNWKQIQALHCMHIAQTVSSVKEVQNQFIKRQHLRKINKILNNYIEYFMQFELSINHIDLLLKSMVYRNVQNETLIEDLLMKYKESEHVSSKVIESVCFILPNMDTLVPEIINKCTEYVTHNKDNIVGFNAEKLLFLCYYFAYQPLHMETFCDTVTDIILRDQERLSGLSFIQSALALCFFNKLPIFFIRMIFNVEFLEKLDYELVNCYSKDKYPHRVRMCLMQLNRAVCLEYPECEVPWFHKKYVTEIEKKFFRNPSSTLFYRVKDYLVGIIGKASYVIEDVFTPYGYHIDFVVHFNENNEIVPANSKDVTTKMAILLCKPYAFTKLYTHLKGKYQMKKRHLEILGYKVVIVKYSEWMNLLYAQERIDFIKNTIHPKHGRVE